MEHKIVFLNAEINGIPTLTKGTIVFEYSTGVYEVEFTVNGKTVTETLTDEDIVFQ
jgi:PKD repeat protein